MSKFNFWCPIQNIEKAKDKDGKEVMRVKGIASTSHKDSDDEFLDPKGFNLKPFLNSGFINYHHKQKESPKYIIGEPHSARITKAGMEVVCDLYPESELAQEVYQTIQMLNKNSAKGRKMGFSVEGHATERDAVNDKKVLAADITGLAITPQPKNSNTFVEIAKAMNDGTFDSIIEKANNKCPDCGAKMKAKGGCSECDYIEKEVSTTTAAPLVKEDLNDKLKVLTKGEVYEKIFSDIPGIDITIAKQIYKLTEKISTMKKNLKSITQDDIAKAYDALGIDAIEKAKKKPVDDDEEEDDEETAEDENEEEDEPKNKKGKKKNPFIKKGADDDDELEEEPTAKKKVLKKAKDEEEETETKPTGALGRIEKAIADSNLNTFKYVRALGTLVKAQANELNKASELIKAQGEQLEELSSELQKANDNIEEIANAEPTRKSLIKPRNKKFEKAEDENEEDKDNIVKGVISRKNRLAVLDILDKKSFEKGFDNEFSQACRQFEATGNLSQRVIDRLKNENQITIQ